MAQIIDYTKSVKDQYIQNTLNYRRHLIESGMEEISKSELINMLSELNYSIDKSMCHSYYNNYNELHYMAMSMSYKDNKTKQSFAHFEQKYTNRENQEKLQKIRSRYFVFENNRILDL